MTTGGSCGRGSGGPSRRYRRPRPASHIEAVSARPRPDPRAAGEPGRLEWLFLPHTRPSERQEGRRGTEPSLLWDNTMLAPASPPPLVLSRVHWVEVGRSRPRKRLAHRHRHLGYLTVATTSVGRLYPLANGNMARFGGLREHRIRPRMRQTGSRENPVDRQQTLLEPTRL